MNKKWLKKVFFFLLLFTTLTVNIYAASSNKLGEGLNENVLNKVTANNTGVSSKFSGVFNNVFGTIFFVLKVLGVAGIAITGVRYMFAGANDKGQIKQSLTYIVIGTILVFGADIIVKLIEDVWLQVS